MNNKVLSFVALVLLTVSCNKMSNNTQVNELKNDDEKASYAFGVNLSNRVLEFEKNLPLEDSLNQDQVKKGISDVFDSSKEISKSEFFGMQIGLQIQEFLRANKMEDKIDKNILIQGIFDKVNKGELLMEESEIPEFLDGYVRPLMEKAQKENQEAVNKRREKESKENQEESTKFLEENKKKQGVKVTDSGLQYEVIKEGDGTTKVEQDDVVSVKFNGTLVDGTVFDSTDKMKEGKVDFPVANVIPGWQEGIKLMTKGAKYKFYIPSELAYGEQGGGVAIGPNQVLIFEVELLDVKDKEPQVQLNANGQPAVPAE
ncbi:MAG: FKBP-type peptidyl-prolyl cis-trans isomerase [Flavobacteriales bacterium]|nr:FKBP-type peptidyl-prolyl cis-trans isomerase [Flavobacteriales bacterium]